MRNVTLLVLGVLLMYGAGCATVLRGEKQSVKIETDPSGATAIVDGVVYTTPATVPLKRKEDHKISIGLAGYRTTNFTIRSTWDGASLPGFLAPGGSASLAVDTASGADLNFYPVPKIKLQPAASDTPPLELIQYRDRLMTKAEFEKLMEEDREQRRQRGVGD